jgi:uncharacterized protein (DUF2147 family)
MWESRWSGHLTAALVWICVAPLKADASTVDGTWKIRNIVLDIFDCRNQVCGRIVWMHDPQRRAAECGKTIVWGLAPDGPSRWAGSWIFDPDNGTTYHLSASLQVDDTLRARIYEGISLFGKTEILMRVKARSLSGWC